MSYEHPLAADWKIHLLAQGVSQRTLEIYLGCLKSLLGDHDPVRVKSRHLEASLAALRVKGASPAYIHQHYRVAKTFFRWLVSEEEIPVSPVDRLAEPIVPEKRVHVLEDDELKRLLDTCKGRDLRSRRDNALIRLLADTGCRREEIVGMTRQNIDLVSKTALVLGKGRKPRPVYFSAVTAEALSRYLRGRKDNDEALWVGRRGPLQPRAIHTIVKRRGEQAGLPGLYPHMLRHRWASEFLERGGEGGDLMRLAGWNTREMLDHYGRAAADRRAAKAYRRVFGE